MIRFSKTFRKHALASALVFAVDSLVFWFAHEVMSRPIFEGVVLGFAAAFLTSFGLQRRWVFQTVNKPNAVKAALRFSIQAAVNIALQVFVLQIFESLPVSLVVVRIPVVLLTFVLNYYVARRWVHSSDSNPKFRWSSIGTGLVRERTWLSLFLAGIFLSLLVPPLQSPDETEHLKRAYLLTQGVVLLNNPNQSDIPMAKIDTGLLAYFEENNFLVGDPQSRYSFETFVRTSSIRWSGAAVLSEITAFNYFPAIYIPQAAGLAIGQVTDLSIDTSYRMARVFNLLCTLALLRAAFRRWRPSFLLIGILALPMYVFQFISCSIDGTMIALLICLAGFLLRNLADREKSHPLTGAAFSFGLATLLMGRQLAAPFVVVALVVAWKAKNRALLFATALAAAATIAWTAHSVALYRQPGGVSVFEKFEYYSQNTAELLALILSTTTHSGLRNTLAIGFVGYLGWLDAIMPIASYLVLGASVCAVGLYEWRSGERQSQGVVRWSFIVGAVGAFVLPFVSMLAFATPIGSAIIEGVQGRYFIVAAILATYALRRSASLPARKSLVWFGLVAYLVVSQASLILTLVDRYWITIF